MSIVKTIETRLIILAPNLSDGMVLFDYPCEPKWQVGRWANSIDNCVLSNVDDPNQYWLLRGYKEVIFSDGRILRCLNLKGSRRCIQQIQVSVREQIIQITDSESSEKIMDWYGGLMDLAADKITKYKLQNPQTRFIIE